MIFDLITRTKSQYYLFKRVRNFVNDFMSYTYSIYEKYLICSCHDLT